MSGVEHFDAVVVGSGFGGAVMAYRLARAGLDVCLLERGRRYGPGGFPRGPHDPWRYVWDPSEGMHGPFNIWSFRGLDAIVASGLGGGSLLYAGVMMRKPERWFVREGPPGAGFSPWPVTLAKLEPHYEQVEHMLGAAPYPYGDHWRPRRFREAAEALGFAAHVSAPSLAVAFDPELRYPAGVPAQIDPGANNLHGRARSACRLCGECILGCNHGSKHSLDYTYLWEAQRTGRCAIRERSEVRTIAAAPGPGGPRYTVTYADHSGAAEGRPRTERLTETTITADQLVLAAGALGSTYLLLKNRARLAPLSPALGTRFSGNGDVLTFAVIRDRPGGDYGGPRASGFGPTITTALTAERGVLGGSGRGFVIEDAGMPEALSWALELLRLPRKLVARRGIVGGILWDRVLGRGDGDLGAEVARLLDEIPGGSKLIPLLGMGLDAPDGTLALREDADGQLDLDWRRRRSRRYHREVKGAMRRLAEAMGGYLIANPVWDWGRAVTVHPVGGCPMGLSEREGVVDDHGEVWNNPGLFVADGAVMPGPVGANPSLTIAALADRFAERVIANHERRRPRAAPAAAEVAR